ncbi:HNH endonuclease signature motif containing protein [Ilumatobacter sp.]|uniref:HNH endonuclease signature motif containing protein n=1 Tax=Ilumatobacter sp. TaxID=1967498 RepID=UPI003AF58179
MEVLVGTELSVADHGELADAASALARIQSFVDHAKVQISRRGRELAESGDTSSNHVLIDEGRCTGSDAKATGGRDRVCETMPVFEEALASGDVTGAHLDSLARHTTGLTDEERSEVAAIADELVDDAGSQPPALFDRIVKGRIDDIRDRHLSGSDAEELERQRQQSNVNRWTDRDTGMHNTFISLDPLRDESFWAVINDHLATLRQDPANAGRPFAELQVETLVTAVSSAPGERRVPEIVVHTDGETLCHGRHAATLCETADGAPVPVATMQRLCCEAVIVRPDGSIDRLCAEQRTAGRKQRRLLEAMYSTCAHPHCEVRFSACRVHHVVWWTRGGRTVLSNLLPRCEVHHHLVHEGGWNLDIDDQRHVTWTKPDGTVWSTDIGPDRRPEPGVADRCGRPDAPRRAAPTAGPPSEPAGRRPGPPVRKQNRQRAPG